MAYDTSTASGMIRDLIKKSGKKISAVAADIGVNENTLYSLMNRQTDLVNIRTLDAVATYFGYDITIFLGKDRYKPRIKLTEAERTLVDDYRKLRPDLQRKVSEIAHNPPAPLTEAERRLLDMFQEIDDEARQRVLQNCEDLRQLSRYRRD